MKQELIALYAIDPYGGQYSCVFGDAETDLILLRRSKSKIGVSIAPASWKASPANVRFGSKADIKTVLYEGPLIAKSGHCRWR